jgi:hypothetical protein
MIHRPRSRNGCEATAGLSSRSTFAGAFTFLREKIESGLEQAGGAKRFWRVSKNFRSAAPANSAGDLHFDGSTIDYS